MSIDFEIPAEAKAIREKVRQWVHDECIPAEKELDSKPLAEVLGRCGPRPARAACGVRGCRRNMAAWAGPLANALVQMELARACWARCR